MNILVANNFFLKMGGSETFCFSIIKELLRLGHQVEYFTFYKGVVADKIEKELGVSFMSKSKYDLILANHNTCVRYLAHKGKLIQTCHGNIHALERPSKFADAHVAVSHAGAVHWLERGFKCQTIYNGIDCDRFKPVNPINSNLQNVLSMCQSDEANDELRQACDSLGLNFQQLNKNRNPKWEVEDMINQADLVVGLGRSAYEAMACGRPVVVYDNRGYLGSLADGYLTADIVENSVYNNCTGRSYAKKMGARELADEFKKYNPQDGQFLRDFALENLNVKKQVASYLEFAETVKAADHIGLYLVMCSQYARFHGRRIKREIKYGLYKLFTGKKHPRAVEIGM